MRQLFYFKIIIQLSTFSYPLSAINLGAVINCSKTVDGSKVQPLANF